MGSYGDAFGVALADQLRAERSAAQLSQRKLAERSGMSEQTVMRYLNGTRDVPMSALANLADALGMKVQTLVERAEQRIPVAAPNEMHAAFGSNVGGVDQDDLLVAVSESDKTRADDLYR